MNNKKPVTFEQWFDQMTYEESIQYLISFEIYGHDEGATIDDWKNIYKDIYLKNHEQ